jgi:hypothetical protein
MLMLTLLIHSAMLGFMLFFVIVISPTAFKALDMKMASRFLRHVFPRLFAFGFVVATAATVTAFLAPDNQARLISLISAVFVLTPRINAMRDRVLAGDTAAKRQFGMLHGASVGLYLVQMCGSIAVIWMLTDMMKITL